MKHYIKFNVLLVSFLTLFFSCETNDEPGPDGGDGNVTLSVLMEPTELFKAKELVASEDGKYIVATLDTRLDGSNVAYRYYYSKDAGQTFSELANAAGFTAVSNNGLLLADNKLINLNDNSVQQIPAVASSAGPVIDASGVAYYINGTLHKFENGQPVDLGITINALKGEMKYSNGKIGFLSMYYSTLAVYDILSNTLSTRAWPVFDTNRLKGASANNNNKAKFAFSDGYFGYASGGAAVSINPSNQLTYYNYPTTYDYQDNPIAVMVDNGKLFLELLENPLRSGNYTEVIKTSFETTGIALEETPLAFPRTQKIGDTFFYTGFIDGGDLRDYGLIKSSATGIEYLKTSAGKEATYSASGFVVEVGSMLYFRNKKYDLNSKKYYYSQFDDILYGFSDNQKSIIYSSDGTYSSIDNGTSWHPESDNGIRPNFVIKNEKGGYYGLTYRDFYYNPGVTGFQISKFDLAVYSSTNGYNWQLIAEHKDLNGIAPKAISSAGHLIYLVNTNPLGSPAFASLLSSNEGLTFQDYKEEVAGQRNYPGLFNSYHEMPNGRVVAFYFQNPNLISIGCSGFVDGCKQAPDVITDLAAGATATKIFYTRDHKAVIGGVTVSKVSGL